MSTTNVLKKLTIEYNVEGPMRESFRRTKWAEALEAVQNLKLEGDKSPWMRISGMTNRPELENLRGTLQATARRSNSKSHGWEYQTAAYIREDEGMYALYVRKVEFKGTTTIKV